MNSDVAAALRNGVNRAYSAAAREPESKHPFPVGAQFAASLGYPEDLLREIPEDAVASFAGVANVSCFAPLSRGDRVLDYGCGSGLDACVSAGRVGNNGCVVAVDFSDDMLRRARASTEERFTNIQFVEASAEMLPLPDASMDAALVNGIFNLNPDRAPLFRELARVLRPGATLAGAELILKEPVTQQGDPTPSNWFS